jgi:hypothetical protein
MKDNFNITISTIGTELVEITSEEADLFVEITKTNIAYFCCNRMVDHMEIKDLGPELRFEFNELTVAHCREIYRRACNRLLNLNLSQLT